MRVTTLDYILIAVGIIMLPLFIGLVLLGVVMWRIGSSMERTSEDSDMKSAYVKRVKTYTEQESQSSPSELEASERYKKDEYSRIILEDGK